MNDIIWDDTVSDPLATTARDSLARIIITMLSGASPIVFHIKSWPHADALMKVAHELGYSLKTRQAGDNIVTYELRRYAHEPLRQEIYHGD